MLDQERSVQQNCLRQYQGQRCLLPDSGLPDSGKVTEKLGKKGYFKMAAFYPVWFDKLKQNESTRDGLTNPY